MKTTEKIIRIRFLIRNIWKVKGRARALGWELKRMTSELIIHTNLHNPNNKLVNAWLEHFWCTNESRAYMDSQNSPRLGLEGSHHLPIILFSMISHGG